MRLALVADTFPPLRSSGAVQLRDLSREFVRQGHNLTVFLPDANLDRSCVEEWIDGVHICRLRAPKTKDIGYVRRTLAELAMPFAMASNLVNSTVADVKWEGVLWYSPSIFHGPFVKALMDRSQCRSYLILRDIFPEWAADMGLMSRGLPFRFFKRVANYQYSVASVIGVQSPGNLAYFSGVKGRREKKLEVLQNWLDRPASAGCQIRVEDTVLAGRQVLVYAGNMGVAQGMDILLALAERLKHRSDVGFLFVGRGSDAARLERMACDSGLDNVVFMPEIDPDEIPSLYAQCAVGLVALSPLHKSHNIPGKFLTYMQSGLPVLANINRGNDLAEIIRRENVGTVCESNDVDELYRLSCDLLASLSADTDISQRCRSLFAREFAVEKTVKQIVVAFG
ncbi:glycosyltransferase family 4 protein [Vogesella mureinivorans]|uniref:glycosyltransferase family 4 protein n=1 Tax=Vogesella mureinivorans TaxID=657276 RepID=UPI0011C9A6B6|nr:glycosyltransferase family 4 protein [Vogesella mureinivorans]